ncbi:MAG: radical SAM protein [Candidatus Cloacimonetes bacterium]|nr:radical SAM protein [Candidatus Cloacimonadota bacterium]
MKIRESKCKSAIGKCGFPSGGWAINPYVGCAHGCVYCYARFMRRFTGHLEEWGSFVDAKVNIAEVLRKQMQSKKFQMGQIFIGTVTDPYQPLEEKYQLTRDILKVLINYKNPVSILTKSDLVLRDIDLLKQFQNLDVGFSITTLDEKWKKLTEPNSPSVKKRFQAMEKLKSAGISLFVMMGPYWPVFTDPEALFKEFKKVGVGQVFTESLNTIGGNWTGVGRILKKHYPEILLVMEDIFFKKKKFYQFYSAAQRKIEELSKRYRIPVTIYFGLGHAAKFE